MGLGKSTLAYRKLQSPTSTSPVLGQKKLVFAHQFSAAGLTDIDLTALVAPTDMTALGFLNPTPQDLASAQLGTMRQNLRLISSSKGELIDWLSYDIITNTLIRLKNGAESDVNEIIFGVLEPVSFNSVAIDGIAIVQTGTILVGLTDIVVGTPFTYNKYSDQQAGDVLLVIDGQIQFRNVGNLSSGEGNFYEVAPSSGNLSNTLRLNAPVAGTAKNYMVLSNGFVAMAPTAAVLARIETIAAAQDQIIQDVALGFGNPTSRYQVAPNSVDLAMFGNYVKQLIAGGIYDFVVGSAAQMSAGLAHFTSVQAAHDAAASGSRILVLQGTYAESLAISKVIFFEGKGHSTLISGTLTFNSGASFPAVKWMKFGDNITINTGVNNCFVREIWQATGKTVTNSGTANSVLVSQE